MAKHGNTKGGAYAAKNSSSMGGLLWTLVKYALVILAILIGITIVSWMLRSATEGFMVPVTPSKEGDEKLQTPAGNIILY
jgi:hypothetical protein